jgi:hypothetical protein
MGGVPVVFGGSAVQHAAIAAGVNFGQAIGEPAAIVQQLGDADQGVETVAAPVLLPVQQLGGNAVEGIGVGLHGRVCLGDQLTQYRDSSGTRQGSYRRFCSCLLFQPKTLDFSLRLGAAFVVNFHAKHGGRGGLRLRCDLAHHCAEVTHKQLGTADLALADRGINSAEAHPLQS